MDGLDHRLRRLFAFRRGILALDTEPTLLAARFRAASLAPSTRTGEDYLAMVLGTPGLAEVVSAVVLAPAAVDDAAVALRAAGILVGVRADTGHEPLTSDVRHRVASGLDGLAERLGRLRGLGVDVAVWSTVAGPVADPSGMAVLTANGHAAARFAHLCHDLGLVPVIRVGTRVVGPRVVDGIRGPWRSATVAAALLSLCGHLQDLGVDLSAVVICTDPAAEPLAVLPDELGGIALTGAIGAVAVQSPPWPLTFYAGRRVTQPALLAWQAIGSVAAGRGALLAGLATAAGGLRAGAVGRVG